MAKPKTDRKPGATARHKAARPIQSRQVGKRAPQTARAEGETPIAMRRPVHIDDEPLLTRSDRPRDTGSFSDDDGFSGSER